MRRITPTPYPAESFLSDPSILGKAVRAARTEAGLRQDELAMFSGVSLQTVLDIERGRPGVAIGKVMAVTKAAGVSLFYVPKPFTEEVEAFIEKQRGRNNE